MTQPSASPGRSRLTWFRWLRTLWQFVNPGRRLLALILKQLPARVPSARPSVRLGIEELEARVVMTAGLQETVFSTANLSGSVFASGTASTVNLTDVSTPSSGAFSTRFSGDVTPLYSQTYTFSTNSSDGVALWLNGRLLINDWTNHTATNDSGSISLTASQSYSLELDYFNNGTDSPTLALSWSSSSQSAQQVPNSALTTASPTGVGLPALTNPGNQSSTEGTSLTLQVLAAGPETTGLAYSQSGLPFGLSLNPTTGLISGTPAAGDGQSIPIRWCSRPSTAPPSVPSNSTGAWPRPSPSLPSPTRATPRAIPSPCRSTPPTPSAA